MRRNSISSLLIGSAMALATLALPMPAFAQGITLAQGKPEIDAALKAYAATWSEANKVPAMSTIAPEDTVKQQRVVDVLNACTAAKIVNVTFAVPPGFKAPSKLKLVPRFTLVLLAL